MAFPRRIVHPLLSLLALAATSCSVWLPGRPVEVHHQVALPADVTATLVAAALRDELRAEAEARAAGAPVSPRADGTFAARFENGPAAQWLAVADARLRVALVDGSGRTRVDVRPPTDGAPLRGFGRGAQRVIELVVTPRAAGCRLTCRGSRELAALVDEVVARTLRLATHDEAGGPGAAEPNLVAWRLGRLIVRAADCEQEDGRAALLRAASRLPDAPCEVFEQLGDLFAAHGQSDRAVANFRRAALRASDPRRRAELAQRAADATDGRRRRDN
ncbi:MAG: hypothetical protein KAI24_14255, partial [Planctomycetes bacterium]|nr:hypothetical protein [Planctomycetota bacterium]